MGDQSKMATRGSVALNYVDTVIKEVGFSKLLLSVILLFNFVYNFCLNVVMGIYTYANKIRSCLPPSTDANAYRPPQDVLQSRRP